MSFQRLRVCSVAFVSILLANCSRMTTASPTIPSNLSSEAVLKNAAQAAATEALQTAASLKTLYSFKGGNDGSQPASNLINVNGELYGTTEFGGSSTLDNGNGFGTVFKISASGVESVLHSFTGFPGDGAEPASGLIDVSGVLYGTTQGGGIKGSVGNGTVYKISTSGAEHPIYSFGFKDAAIPTAPLVAVGGEMYGTASDGAANGYGAVFKVSTSGAESVIYAFDGSSDGGAPEGGLIDVNGVLYGTTFAYGVSGSGTVFKSKTTGDETVIYPFKSKPDGALPAAALLNDNGTLYGTTEYGGVNGVGSVFKVSPSGIEKVVYSFKARLDGNNPVASLIDVNGTLYGTTAAGGTKNYGTVFSLTTAGVEHVLYNFTGGADGADPRGSLIDLNGVLYGTTKTRGKYGYGTVFAVGL